MRVRVFANSLATKRECCRIYGYPPDRVRICSPGVDTLVFHPPPHATRNNQLVTIGRLTHFKNVDVIIRAVDILRRTRDVPVVLKIVGAGEAEADLRQLARDLDLDREVIFCGSLVEEALVRTLQESKVFLLASVDEPFGIVTVEAMACGTPGVVSNSGGPAETVLDGKTGFHVRGGDPASYAEKARLLLDDDRLFDLMSAQAVLRAGQYSWDASADGLAGCFMDYGAP